MQTLQWRIGLFRIVRRPHVLNPWEVWRDQTYVQCFASKEEAEDYAETENLILDDVEDGSYRDEEHVKLWH